MYFVKLLQKSRGCGCRNIVYLGHKTCCGETAGNQPLCAVKSVQLEAHLRGNRVPPHHAAGQESLQVRRLSIRHQVLSSSSVRWSNYRADYSAAVVLTHLAALSLIL